MKKFKRWEIRKMYKGILRYILLKLQQGEYDEAILCIRTILGE